MNKLPYLRFWDNTPVVVDIGDGNNSIDENGVPITSLPYSGKCNLDEKTRVVRDADGVTVELSGVITIGKDIAPSLATITGKVTIGERKYTIHASSRPRNPDGTVNHTRLELK